MNLRLVRKQYEIPEIVTYFFLPDEEFDFTPGQFLRYHLPSTAPDERGENRFFSISSAPFEKVIKLTTRITSKQQSTFKTDLSKLKAGDIVEAFGPSGKFTVEDVFISEGKKLCFIAGGIGITPFRSILLDLDHRNLPLNITLLYANRTKDILFKNELEALAKKHPEFKINYVRLINESLISSSLLPLHSLLFYISGPEPMVILFEEMLIKMGAPKENIKTDEFPGYENY